jgi:pantetheine hydrolase
MSLDYDYGYLLFQAMLPFCEAFPDPRLFSIRLNPCTEEGGFLFGTQAKNFSCMSRTHKMLISFNTCDVQYCEPGEFTQGAICNKDGRLQFNSELVFDQDGFLVARYHKSHLFGEAGFLFKFLIFF